MKRAVASPAALTPAPARNNEARDHKLALWVVAAAAGDATAFESFYEHSFALARTVARRLLRGADVEDLLADAYFEAWRSAARFDVSRGSAITWLLTIVHSRSLDLLRRKTTASSAAAAAFASSEGDADAVPTSRPQADPAERLWQRQIDARLKAALSELSAAERWVLGLAYFRELSHAQIAGATGLPLGTVKTHLLRAQQRLRVLLAPTTEPLTNRGTRP